ncbi:MAG: carboxypeptidase-like regulatory domain-containing protein [Marinisporobacter sp.]|nr:carboxypeptidase-like regulatory domain-containing protein [Marinisporobacter sp.]
MNEREEGFKTKDQKVQDQSSMQQNTQDLDQQQHVQANPSQVNYQSVQVNPQLTTDRFAGKITGITYSGHKKEIIANVNILLYFGAHVKISDYPVYKTQSDACGNFSIQDLPPGYYTLHAYLDENLKETLYAIKVMIGQAYFQSIFLRKAVHNEIEKERVRSNPSNTDYFLSKL